MKYPFAIYFEDNQWEKVTPEELYDTDFRAKLRSVDLFDKDKKFQLFIRFRKECPHFYSRGKNRQNFTSEKDTEKHFETIRILNGFINKRRKQLRICSYDWSDINFNKNGEPEINEIHKISEYDWKNEVKQVISSDGYVKPDIIGRSKTLELSDKKPQLIIEVVHTHFLTFEAFDNYRFISEQIPITIIIYFVQGRGKYNNMKGSRIKEDIGLIRVSFYILDGSFWINNERFEEIYPNLEKCDLNNRVDYYNAVQEFRIRKIINDKNAL